MSKKTQQTIKTKGRLQRGSEWQKWDLHVHSPKVFLNNQYGNASAEDFVNKLVDSKITAVGLTNYFRFDDEELGDIKDKLTAKGITVFPNIEFRTQPPNKENEEMHVHVLFSNDVSSQKIKNFLGRLKTVDGKYCKDLTIEDIKTTTVSIDTLKNTLAEDEDIKHLEDYLIVACPRGQGNFRPSGDDDVRGSNFAVVIDKYSDVLFGNANDTEFFLKQDRYENAKPKPVVLCSDAHKLDDIGKKFSWIKSETTFEGLKQILYDPRSRVAIQDNKPVQPNNVISSITFNISPDAKITVKQKDGSEKEEQFCFAGANSTYYLSPFFNCFVGGRGSGKSTILNFLGQHSKDSGSSQAFWEKIQPSFDTNDSNIFSFEGVALFEFIGQSEVESFATDKEAFTNAIYERANILSDGALETDQAKLGTLLRKIRSFQSLIESIEELFVEKKLKEKEKTALESAVKITKSREYSKIVDDITNKSSQKQRLEGWRTVIDELRISIEELQKQYVVADLNENNDENVISAENDGDTNIAQKYQEAYEKAKINVAKAVAILDPTNFKDLVKKENTLAKEIEDLEKQLSELLKKSGLSDENILQVKGAPKKIVRIDDELSKLEKKIEDKQKEINEYDNVLKETQKVRKEYEKIIEEWIEPLTKTLNEQAESNNQQDIKSIGLNYFFDEQEVWRQIANEFYSHFSEQHKDGERPDLLKNYIVENKTIFLSKHKKIKDFLSKQEKKVGYIKFLKNVFDKKSNYQIFLTIRDRHLNDVAKYKRIQVLYDRKDIERASFGQKCTAVMVILLLFGNYPLIIDEPEAHLDSSLIANYLVPLIKRKKNNRQIIFATHNANFVVNGDAEKIFILKNETGITEVVETTIENLRNRDELLKLEGGRNAFRKRGEKLHI